MSHSKSRRRQGTTLVTLLMATAMASLVMVGGFRLLGGVSRAERRTDASVDAASELARAQLWLDRDLSRMLDAPPTSRVEISDEGRRAQFQILPDDWSEPARSVSYSYDRIRGVLQREAEGEGLQRFHLGPRGVAVFVILEPSYAFGGPSRLGAYHNRLVYRLSADLSRPNMRSPGITVVGTAPFLVKASRETFPFWNGKLNGFWNGS